MRCRLHGFVSARDSPVMTSAGDTVSDRASTSKLTMTITAADNNGVSSLKISVICTNLKFGVSLTAWVILIACLNGYCCSENYSNTIIICCGNSSHYNDSIA